MISLTRQQISRLENEMDGRHAALVQLTPHEVVGMTDVRADFFAANFEPCGAASVRLSGGGTDLTTGEALA